MLANVSTPLIGIVDTAVVGQIPDPAQIGAVALGALVFTTLFWAFGFLRMGTTGLTAQALGAQDADEIRASLGRATVIALAVGALLILLAWPIRETTFWLLDGSHTVESLARDYFDIRIWSAPAALVNYALLGWFIGLARANLALALQLVLNLTNIVLDAYFVLVLDLGVAGVALGTLIAECTAAVAGIALAVRQLAKYGGRWQRHRLLDALRLRRTIAVNGDIMIRSLALLAVFAWFLAQGAKQGDLVLAANAILMHFVSVSAYFLDAFAFAAEALVGRATGARHRSSLIAAMRMTTAWAAGIAVLACTAIAAFGPAVIDALTVDEPTRTLARDFLPWAALAPLLGVWSFQLDGIFIGATHTREMRNAMLLSTVIFAMAWWALASYGNHGLWASFQVHYAARTLTLLAFVPRLLRSVRA